MFYALATSTGYSGRRPLPWLACNVARALVLIFVLAHDQAKDGRVEEYVLSLKEIKEKISIVRYSKRGIYPCCLLLIADRVFQNPARLPT